MYGTQHIPVIKIRDVERHRKRLGDKPARMFDEKLYRRLRGVAETIFGSETKHGNKTNAYWSAQEMLIS